MFDNIDQSIRFAHQRHQDAIAAAAQERLLRASGRGPLPLTRRAARPLGRAMIRLGAWLMRYGRVDGAPTMQTYRPPVRSVKPR